MFLPQQNPIDATLPASMDVAEVHDWPLEITELLSTLFDHDNAPLLAMGNNLWTGLSLIVIVWTGSRIAFSGASFRAWDLVTLAIGLTIPLGMLRFYTADVPGVGLSFPLIIPAGADAIAAAFQGDMAVELHSAEARLAEGLRQNLEAATAGEDTPGILQLGALIGAHVQNIWAQIQTFFFGITFFASFALVYALCLAQVIWAKVALGILVYLGPVLIPWLVWRPMAFLFWGWFKAIWVYSFYGIIAAAVLRIFVAICITLIESVNATFAGVGVPPTEGPEAFQFLMAVIPLLAAAFMAALKVPELAGSIVGSPAGGGIAGAASMAMTGGKAKLAKMAGGLK